MAILTVVQVRELPLLDDEVRFSDALLQGLIDEFTGTATEYLGVSPVSVSRTVTRPCPNGQLLALPNTYVTALTSVTIDGTALSTADRNAIKIDGPNGDLIRTAGWPGYLVAVVYTHGLSTVPPAVTRACREFVRAKALEAVGNQPRNTIGYTDDSGFSYREGTADWDAGRPTGLRVVDDALNTVANRRPMVH